MLRFVRIEHLLQQLHYAPFATLVCAHGRNFGAGADLVCACGTRIAAPGATFRMPGLRFGIVLGTRRLAQRIGTDAAREILSTSRTFDADEGLRLRFLTQIAARADWPSVAAAARKSSGMLTRPATARLNERTVTDTRAADLAALVESVSVPGLKERIRTFRESQA